MAKKKVVKKEKEEVVVQDDSKILNSAIVILIILCIFGGFFLLTYKLTNNDSSKDDKNQTGEKDTTESEEAEDMHREKAASSIMLGSSFNRDENEYLVVFYDGEDDEIAGDLDSILEHYLHDDESLAVYKVDMSSKFNSSYKNDSSNRNASSPSELKINGTTLIKIVNGEIDDYIEGTDEVRDYFE